MGAQHSRHSRRFRHDRKTLTQDMKSRTTQAVIDTTNSLKEQRHVIETRNLGSENTLNDNNGITGDYPAIQDSQLDLKPNQETNPLERIALDDDWEIVQQRYLPLTPTGTFSLDQRPCRRLPDRGVDSTSDQDKTTLPVTKCSISATPQARTSKARDPLVESSEENYKNSYLLRLPDEILFHIYALLDACSLESFRRVSRRLCYQVGKADLGHLIPWPECRDTGPPWLKSLKFSFLTQSWPRTVWTEESRGEFLRLLDRDRYCNGCLRARRAPDWPRRVEKLREYLYCAACRTQHPACLFSPEQRCVQRPDEDRNCIGHQGFLRLCEHDEGIIRWPRFKCLLQEARLRRQGKSVSPKYHFCPHDSHLRNCRSLRDKDIGVFSKACDSTYYPRPVLVFGYSHTTHRLGATTVTPRSLLSISMYWSAHLDLEEESTPITRSYLLKRMAEVNGAGGRFICPQEGPAQPTLESRLFDPQICACLSSTGADPWIEPRVSPAHLTIDWLTGPVSDDLDQAKELAVPGPTSQSSHWSKRSFTNMEHKGEVDIMACRARQCYTGRRCLIVEYERRREIEDEDDDVGSSHRTTDKHWFQSLATDSYGLTSDAEAYQVSWCKEKECLNYHEYNRGCARLLRNADYCRA